MKKMQKFICDACKKAETKGCGQDKLVYKDSNGVVRTWDICPDCARQITQILGPGQSYGEKTANTARNRKETPISTQSRIG